MYIQTQSKSGKIKTKIEMKMKRIMADLPLYLGLRKTRKIRRDGPHSFSDCPSTQNSRAWRVNILEQPYNIIANLRKEVSN